MWRRACLGSPDDVQTLVVVWLAAAVGATLVVAGTLSWLQGIVAGVVVSSVAHGVFSLQRRQWDHFVATVAADGVVRLMHMLESQHPPERPSAD